MKCVRNHYIYLIFLAVSIFSLNQPVMTQSKLSAQDEQIKTKFETNAKAYSKLRERLEEKLPKLATDATPEQIGAHKEAFQKLVLAARTGAKQGEIFTPDASRLIRNIIKNEYQGQDRLELRETVLEGDTKGVPVKINAAYPDSKEQIEMPPTLLLNLPQLPKQLRYRFVGRSLLLLDRENGLIVDYMLDALP